MTPEEFARLCQSIGYCRKELAEQYAKGKDELTEKDFEAVFGIVSRRISHGQAHNRLTRIHNGYTTKIYEEE